MTGTVQGTWMTDEVPPDQANEPSEDDLVAVTGIAQFWISKTPDAGLRRFV